MVENGCIWSPITLILCTEPSSIVLNPPDPHFQGSGRIFEFWRAPWEIFTHDIALFRLIFLNFLILNWKIFILSKNVQNTQIRFMMWFSIGESCRDSLKLAENFLNKNWPAFILHLEIGQATILPYEFDFRGYFLGRGSSKYFPVFFPWKVSHISARDIIWKKMNPGSDIPRWKALNLLFPTV